MKMISIDVGIKNLAVCCFEILSNNDFTLPIWKVIDLENHTSSCICEYTYTKEGNIIHSRCNKKATVFDEENHFYCNVHGNMKTKEKKLKKIKKIPTNMITLGQSLKMAFDLLFEHHFIDLVIIENQISPIASKMTTLQGMIAQYFIMKNVAEIKYVSAINKLKYFEMKKNTYSERKKLSVLKCREIIQTIPSLRTTTNLLTYEVSTKKDDLADSFLQGIVYLIDSGNLILDLQS